MSETSWEGEALPSRTTLSARQDRRPRLGALDGLVRIAEATALATVYIVPTGTVVLLASIKPGPFQQRLLHDLGVGVGIRWRRSDGAEFSGRIDELVVVLGDRDRIAWINPFLGDALAVDLGTVSAVEVLHVPISASAG